MIKVKFKIGARVRVNIDILNHKKIGLEDH